MVKRASGIKVRVSNPAHRPVVTAPVVVDAVEPDGFNADLENMVASGFRGSQRTWTDKDNATLKRYAGKVSAKNLARVLNRTTTSIHIQMRRLEIKLLPRRSQ